MHDADSTAGRLVREIHDYWDERAESYSNGVIGELGDGRKDAWKASLGQVSAEVLRSARAEKRIPRACDLGCGPGFFTILLAELGFAVDAVDASEIMIRRAQENLARVQAQGSATFHASDLLALPFPDCTFDVCASRNVTWLMRDPKAAYAEWLRVLRPGGMLVVYDANWYRYLVDSRLAEKRAADQQAHVLEGWADDARATSDEERRCEELAMSLPLTFEMRPAWDLGTLEELGVSRCRADIDAWRTVWSSSEQLYYGATPLFMIEVVK